MLRQCVAEAENDRETPQEIKDRIAGMLDFIEILTKWYEQVKTLPKPTLVKLMKLGAKIASFIKS